MVDLILHSLLPVIILQVLLLSLFLFTHRKGKRLSNRLLAMFFLFLGINLIDGLIGFTGFYQKYPALAHLEDGLVFLLGPLLYFYTRSVVYRDFQLRGTQLYHLMPFVLVTVVFQAYYHSQTAEEKLFIQRAISERQLPAGFYITIFFVYGHVFTYFFLALREIRIYQRRIREFFSSTEKVSLKWLRFIIYTMTGILLISLVNVMAPYIGMDIWFLPTFAIVVGLFFLFANALVFKGLQQPEIFAGLEQKGIGRYSNSTLTANEKENIKSRLVDIVENGKAYLELDLNLEELSAKVGIQPKKISQVLNESFGQNYYDFINSYRIEEAKRILSGSPDPKLTVLEVLYKVGFNSKSSFNTVFREKTGTTPSSFRKDALQKLQAK